MKQIRCLLAGWLKLQKLTQADVVRETGLSPNAVNRMYHNHFDRVDCKTAITLCDYLGCSFDQLFVLERDGQLIGTAFAQARELQPEFMAETIEHLMEKAIARKHKEIENYETRCREGMKTEIELHIAKYQEQHEALLQNTSDICAGMIEYMKGATESLIESLGRQQRGTKIAKDLADSQSLACSAEVTELGKDEWKLILSSEATSDG